ncbi:hypothetical protein [Streptomyces sp. NPDC002602]|uniref:hypothetical protein n=1 Tax=Streptomyces sp. NPDC002602 TaxID=3364654 RepID=UPI0036B86357
MWFFDAIASGFQHPTDPGRLQAFRTLFGAVLTARFALSVGQGGWNRLVAGSLSRHLAEQRFGPARARLLAGVYRPALIMRTIAALALAAGLLSRISLLLVLAGAAMELLYLKSPNAVRYTLLTGGALLAAGNLGHGLTIEHTPNTANTWAQCLLVLIRTSTGTVPDRSCAAPNSAVASTSRSGSTPTARSATGFPTRVSTPSPASSAGTRATSPRGTCDCGARSRPPPSQRKFALPPALLIPQTMPYAIAAGIAMHTAFTCLKPRQLITFSGLTLATYLAFAA